MKPADATDDASVASERCCHRATNDADHAASSVAQVPSLTRRAARRRQRAEKAMLLRARRSLSRDAACRASQRSADDAPRVPRAAASSEIAERRYSRPNCRDVRLAFASRSRRHDSGGGGSGACGQSVRHEAGGASDPGHASACSVAGPLAAFRRAWANVSIAVIAVAYPLRLGGKTTRSVGTPAAPCSGRLTAGLTGSATSVCNYP